MHKQITGNGSRYPLNTMDSIRSMLDILWNGLGKDLSNINFNTNIDENSNEYIITAELPNFNKEDININLNGSNLTINAARREETYYRNGGFISRGMTYRNYTRTFYVENINQSGINGSFNNGILKLLLPKLKNSKLYLLK